MSCIYKHVSRFDENPAMTLQDTKDTKRHGQRDKVKTVYQPQTKFAGGITNKVSGGGIIKFGFIHCSHLRVSGYNLQKNILFFVRRSFLL